MIDSAPSVVAGPRFDFGFLPVRDVLNVRTVSAMEAARVEGALNGFADLVNPGVIGLVGPVDLGKGEKLPESGDGFCFAAEGFLGGAGGCRGSSGA